MADVQDLFERFHGQIRTYYEINETLRQKKNIIVDRLKEHLRQKSRPTFDEFVQGSYKMKVGICAIEGAEFDIDVGLRFAFAESEYKAAVVHQWVSEAVDGHTESVEAKGPCVRVSYADGYHVDLVSYAWWKDGAGVEQYRMAHKSNGWRPSDPPRLVEHVRQIRKPFDSTEDGQTQTDQFRRVVRYLKRWNDIAIPAESNEKPSGLALLLLTENYLSSPVVTWDGTSDDRRAVELVARGAANTTGRISAIKPTPEGEDMFARISESGMAALKGRFRLLLEALVDAQNLEKASEACKRLRDVFGSDFPCPEPDDDKKARVRRTAAPAIVPSSESA